jgi:hypothetical protein
MFEDYGVWSDGRTPIRRCRNCGTGFLAKKRRVLAGFRISQIDDATWGKIQALIDRERELRGPARAEPPGEAQIRAHVRALEGRGHSGETLVHIVAEWLGVDSEQSRAAVEQALGPSAG